MYKVNLSNLDEYDINGIELEKIKYNIKEIIDEPEFLSDLEDFGKENLPEEIKDF